jgi:hypothetical protein
MMQSSQRSSHARLRDRPAGVQVSKFWLDDLQNQFYRYESEEPN